MNKNKSNKFVLELDNEKWFIFNKPQLCFTINKSGKIKYKKIKVVLSQFVEPNVPKNLIKWVRLNHEGYEHSANLKLKLFDPTGDLIKCSLKSISSNDDIDDSDLAMNLTMFIKPNEVKIL